MYIWLNELENAQVLPEVPSPGALFQTKAKYKKLKEQTDRKERTVEEINNKGILLFWDHSWSVEYFVNNLSDDRCYVDRYF